MAGAGLPDRPEIPWSATPAGWGGRNVEAASRHPGWPATLGPAPTGAGELTVRPLQRRDGPAWRRLRMADEKLIAPWDASSPLTWADRHTRAGFRNHRRLLLKAAGRGEVLPFGIEIGGRFVGQVTVGGIQRGALCSGWVGYWVSSQVHRRGVATAAVRLTVEHAFAAAGLHRVEATVAPENAASLGVIRRLGFRQEGLLRRYLDVGGSWHDHLLFALTVEELGPGGKVLGPRPGPTPVE